MIAINRWMSPVLKSGVYRKPIEFDDGSIMAVGTVGTYALFDHTQKYKGVVEPSIMADMLGGRASNMRNLALSVLHSPNVATIDAPGALSRVKTSGPLVRKYTMYLGLTGPTFSLDLDRMYLINILMGLDKSATIHVERTDGNSVYVVFSSGVRYGIMKGFDCTL